MIPYDKITLEIESTPCTIINTHVYQLFTERQETYKLCNDLYIWCKCKAYCHIEPHEDIKTHNVHKFIFPVWIRRSFLEVYRQERNKEFA